MPKSEQSLNELLYDIKRIEEHREVLTENKIRAMYRQLMDDLDTFLAKNYKKYADEDGRLYTSYLDAQRKRASFLNEIIKNVDSIEPSLQKEITKLVNETYRESYKGMAEAVKSAKTSKELAYITKDLSVRPEVLKQAVNNNISKLTLPAVLEKHRSEVIYQIQQELGVGLMNGDRYEKMAKRISERLDVSYSKAMNITRTETHRNIESGFMDCAEHIQEGMEGSGYIYAATWRTRLDERVRPQQRRKTKKGWKTSYSNNGANHMVMEGKTVKAGEPFDLGNGVKAKAPSQSGVAAHDCNCRCFLEYNLMTAEEFAKATGMTVEAVKKKYLTNYDKGGIIDAENYTLKSPGNIGEKATPYSERGIEIEPRLQECLNSLKKNGDYISVEEGTFTLQDLAILTTETGVEFTLITTSKKSHLIRGTERGTLIPQNLLDDMIEHHGVLNGHSHPFIGDLIPSAEDQSLLAQLPWQEESAITDPYQDVAWFTKSGTKGKSAVREKLYNYFFKED